MYLLLIMVDNGFLHTPAISSFTLLLIVQVLCNSGVGQDSSKHVLSWLQGNRKKVALDPPEEKKQSKKKHRHGPARTEWVALKIAEVGRTDQETYREDTGRQRHAQHDAIWFHSSGTRGVTQVHRVVTYRCNPSKWRVKHSHIHLHKWKKGNSSLSPINNGKTLNLGVTTCFATSLQQQQQHLTIRNANCIATWHPQWFIKQCNFEVKLTGMCPIWAQALGLLTKALLSIGKLSPLLCSSLPPLTQTKPIQSDSSQCQPMAMAQRTLQKNFFFANI